MPKSSKPNLYLHGYSSDEQDRLYHQARFLEPWVYEGVDLRKARRLLEVGSGVGAQTKILLERFPKLHITCVDLSKTQVGRAREHLKKEIKAGRVELHVMSAYDIGQLSGTFDAVFLCWFLEHVPEPLRVLKAVRKKLKVGGQVICSEVQNASLFVDPYSPAILKYWFEFNDFQWSHKGHPFIGAQLGNLLQQSGFRRIETEVRTWLWDSRNKAARRAFIHDLRGQMLSAAPALLAERRITNATLQRLERELRRLETASKASYFNAWVRAHAKK